MWASILMQVLAALIAIGLMTAVWWIVMWMINIIPAPVRYSHSTEIVPVH